MPELPEVETVRAGLSRWVSGRRMADVEVLHPRAIRRHLGGAADFSGSLAGVVITSVQRRGKYLWLALDSGDAVVGHLGMSGQMLMQPTGAADEKHLRIRFRFDDGGPELRFVDQRTFGGLAVSRGGAGLPAEIAHIALDPFDASYVEAAVAAALRAKKTEVKRALLDQTLISGVGNIYADEALWRARLHYARPTETTTRRDATALLDAAREVMSAALAQGGTSFDALYVNVNGESGYFDRSLHAYGQAGRPCARCGTPIRRDAFMGRSSFTCPTCQRVPRRAHW